jgi:phenylacetate-CoA ligase
MQQTNNALLSWPHEVPASVAHTWADAHFIHALELGPSQWWQQWQAGRLAELRAWLGEKTWWNAWAVGRGGPPSSTAALDGLPIMTREDYRRLIAAHAPEAPASHGAISDYSTSGSSGVPVTFWRTEMALRINANHYWADHQRQGRDLARRMAVISGFTGEHGGTHRIDPGKPWLRPGQQLCRLVTHFSMDEHAQWLCENTIDYLATTPATLSAVLSAMHRLVLTPPRIAQVLTSSYCVDTELRERTRETFGASIRDRYSCEEVGPLAFQCPESDAYYHCAVANALIEVVDDRGHHVASNEQGNVLITGLHQWSSPAVRYELGDIATWHPTCPGCGTTVPALSQLLGRKHFLIKRPNGEWHHIRMLAEHWLPCAPFLEYRLVQTTPITFRAEVVLGHAITPTEVQSTIAMLQALIGTEYTFELVQLNAIAWPPGRKRQEFVGLLP